METETQVAEPVRAPASRAADRASSQWGGIRLGRVGGIELRAHASWLLVVALVTWSFWDRFDAQARFAGPTAFVMALGAALLFFASVLSHELAHALEARHRGIRVAGITLFLFGGATQMSSEAHRPTDEFAVTALGPFTSLTTGAVMGLLATGADRADLHELAAVCGVVGWLNVGLALFNLLPGAPLDGGRIVRALAWRVSGDRYRATRIACRAGQTLGGLMVGLGLFQIFFIPAAFTGGLWIAFLGWFLSGAASTELAQAEIEQALAGTPLRQLASRVVEPIPAGASVADAVDHWFRVYDRDAFFVTEMGRPPIGALTVDDIRRVPRPDRDRVSVREVMRPIDGLPWLDAGAPSASVLDELQAQGAAVVVDDGGGPLGLVTHRDVLARLRREQELDR